MPRSVDQLRRLLRNYIEFADARLGQYECDDFQSLRIERTTRFLQYACQGLELCESSVHATPSLFEQLTLMAFDAVDRHVPLVPALAETAALRSVISSLEEIASQS